MTICMKLCRNVALFSSLSKRNLTQLVYGLDSSYPIYAPLLKFPEYRRKC